MKELITPDWKNKKNKIKSLFHKIASSELLQLTEPCYKPELKKYENEIFAASGLNKKDIQTAIKRFYSGSKVKSNWLLESDPMSNLLILYMHYFLTVRDTVAFSSVMLYYNIRVYTNLYHRFFKFCKPDVFLYTLETINRSHIYAREKTIPNAIFHFSKDMIRRWEKTLYDLNNPDEISKFIREVRHRHAQSIKSFVEAYHRNVEAGHGVGVDYEQTMQKDGEEKSVETTLKSPVFVDKLIDKITLYGYVDEDAILKSQKITQINSLYAHKMAASLANSEFHQHIQFILRFYVSQLKKMTDLCSTGYIRGVQNLLRSRKEGPQELKAHIAELNQQLFKKMRLTKQYNKFTLQTRYTYIAFTLFYITMCLKHSVCK